MEKGERQTFSRNERLRGSSLIDDLFKTGNFFTTSLFRVIWMIPSEQIPSPAQIAVSVPKRAFRHANDRNLLKRRIRESYRRRKQSLYSFLIEEDIRLIFILIYRSNRIEDFSTIDRSVKEAIDRLCKNAALKHGKS